jgi:iron complex transport system substrate-binding protein
VRVELPPQRIIALAPAFVEIFFAIGAGNSVAAVDNFSNYPAAAADLPHLDAFQPSVEGIAALNPDLVLIFFDPGGLQEALERLGITVLFLAFPSSVQEVFDQVELLGRVTGHEDEAEAVVAEMREGIDEITGKLAGLDQGPRVFHELTTDLWTVGPGSFVHDLYRLLKAENIGEATGLPATQMSAEAIIEADPEVIILADAEFGDSPETVAARPGWSNIAAVRNGRIYAVDPDIISQPGPRLVEGLETLARLLYPERFQ